MNNTKKKINEMIELCKFSLDNIDENFKNISEILRKANQENRSAMQSNTFTNITRKHSFKHMMEGQLEGSLLASGNSYGNGVQTVKMDNIIIKNITNIDTLYKAFLLLRLYLLSLHELSLNYLVKAKQIKSNANSTQSMAVTQQVLSVFGGGLEQGMGPEMVYPNPQQYPHHQNSQQYPQSNQNLSNLLNKYYELIKRIEILQKVKKDVLKYINQSLKLSNQASGQTYAATGGYKKNQNKK